MLCIRELREARAMSQKDLADLLGITPSAVSHWETGRRIPDVMDMIALAAALGCKVEDLIKEEEQ